MTQPSGELLPDFVPCPMCKQYSHSIAEDRLAAAFNHFQSMIAHPMRGHPMGSAFDERTRDAAQVLMAAARTLPALTDEMVEKALHARVPGGAEVWCFLPQKDAFTPSETARAVIRAAISVLREEK